MAESTNVTLADVRDLRRVWPQVGLRIEVSMVAASRSAAQWAAAQATRNTTVLGAVASRTYQRSHRAMPLRDGAIVTNTAEHAYFVEIGRNPGRAPPVSVIMQWLKLKGFRATGKVRPPRIVGEVSSGKQRARMRKAIRERARRDAERPLRGMAFAVAWKIGRRGTDGYFILRKLLPRISARWQMETRRQLLRLTRDPPR
jgi:hypothetical protein